MNFAKQLNARPKIRSAISLLEVVLSLAILGAAGAMLAQSMQVATDAGIQARDQALAELLAESKMSEMIAGAYPANQSTDFMEIQTVVDPGRWYFKILSQPAVTEGMLTVQVWVTDDPQLQQERPVQVMLTRWMIDPNLGLDVLPEETTETGTSSSTGSSSTGTQ